MRQVNVIGGTGYLGRRTVEALAHLPGIEVRAMGRRGPHPLDVTRPETWTSLEGASLVIDLGDATRVAPDDLVGWCLERGIPVLEATSDAPCIERLHRRFSVEGSARAADPGRLFLGAGIFTGVSNLLGRAVARDLGGAAERITLGISSSPFSGAGASTIALMLSALRQPLVRFLGGRRVEQAGMELGPTIDFGVATRPTLRAPFAEAFMLHESTGAPNVEVLLAPYPTFLHASFAAMPHWMAASRLGQWILGGYFTALRRLLLRSLPTEVALYAAAEGHGQRSERRVVAPDGMRAGAYAIAALAEAILDGAAAPGKPVTFIDEVCALEPVVARACQLSGGPLLRLLPG